MKTAKEAKIWILGILAIIGSGLNGYGDAYIEKTAQAASLEESRLTEDLEYLNDNLLVGALTSIPEPEQSELKQMLSALKNSNSFMQQYAKALREAFSANGSQEFINTSYSNLIHQEGVMKYTQTRYNFWTKYKTAYKDYWYTPAGNGSVPRFETRIQNIEQKSSMLSQDLLSEIAKMRPLLGQIKSSLQQTASNRDKLYDSLAVRSSWIVTYLNEYKSYRKVVDDKSTELNTLLNSIESRMNTELAQKQGTSQQESAQIEKTYAFNYGEWKSYLEKEFKRINDIQGYVFGLDLNQEVLPDLVRTQLASLKGQIIQALFPEAQRTHTILRNISETYSQKQNYIITQSELDAFNNAAASYQDAAGKFGSKYKEFVDLFNSNRGKGNAGNLGDTQWGIGARTSTDPNINQGQGNFQGQQQGYRQSWRFQTQQRQTWSWRINPLTGRYEYFVNGQPATWDEFRAAGGLIN